MTCVRHYWKWVWALSVVMTGFCALASAESIGAPAVEQCVKDILQQEKGFCLNYVSLRSVTKVDGREVSKEAFVIADVELLVKQQIGAKSKGTFQCTGSGWIVDPPKNPYPPNSGQWLMFQSQADMDGGYLEAGQVLRIQKKFRFELWDSGWRCAETSLGPVDKGWLVKREPPPLTSSRPAERSTTPVSPRQSTGSARTKSRSGLCIVRGGATNLVTELFPMGGDASEGKRINEEFKTAHCINNPDLKCSCYLGNPGDNTSLMKMRDGILTGGGKSLDWKPGGQ
jgi:hypothetical protein